MKQMQTVYAMYFSPTQTSKKAACAAARAMAEKLGARVEQIDLTRPENRGKPYSFGPEEALVLAYPVYGGRMPALLEGTMEKLKGQETPAVALAVYGNRAYEDALLEGADWLEKQGFQMAAAGAFIGEHSFSASLAAGRPDQEDLAQAAQLGEKAAEKMLAGPLNPLELPGARPYKERGPAKEVSPKTADSCLHCGTCAQVCPMGVIHGDDPCVTDPGCIRCCACVKACPAGARQFDDPGIAQSKTWLETNFSAPQKVQLFW